MKIFVTNYNGNYDYSAAEKHGELVFMTHGYIPMHRFDSAMKSFENYAKESGPDDKLLLSGSNLICALAVLAWSRHRPHVELMQHGIRSDSSANPSYIFYRVQVDQVQNDDPPTGE